MYYLNLYFINLIIIIKNIHSLIFYISLLIRKYYLNLNLINHFNLHLKVRNFMINNYFDFLNN